MRRKRLHVNVALLLVGWLVLLLLLSFVCFVVVVVVFGVTD